LGHGLTDTCHGLGCVKLRGVGMTETHFTTTLTGAETGPTGFVVPPENVAALGSGKRPAVLVRVNGHAYQSTVAVMAGDFMIGFAAVHRAATGLKAGDRIDVVLTLETAPRVVEVPQDLATALDAAGLRVIAVDPSFKTKSSSRTMPYRKGVRVNRFWHQGTFCAQSRVTMGSERLRIPEQPPRIAASICLTCLALTRFPVLPKPPERPSPRG
jgi:hypothetical protein